jgi:hypothetical protein
VRTDNKIGKNFDNLAQRMVYVYLGSFPRFVPVKSEQASEYAQKQMFRFLEDMLCKLYDNPALIDLPLPPDDCYEDWMLNNKKPFLIKAMRSINKSITSFFTILHRIGEVGIIKDNRLYVDKKQVRITSKTLAQLAQFGVDSDSGKDQVVFWSDAYAGLFPAWKLLASVSSENQNDPLIEFSRGMFDPTYPYNSDIYSFLSGNETLFFALETFFKVNGYERLDNQKPSTSADNGIRIDWRKSYTEKDSGGIDIWFDFRKRNPLKFELRVPRFRELLLTFDSLGDPLKQLAVERAKKCDNCGYCIQTDKTRRKRMAYTAEYQGETYALCPFFPNLTWTYLDEKAVSDIKNLLTYTERTLPTL